MVTYCYCSTKPHPYVSALCGPGIDGFNAPIDRTKRWPAERTNDADQENEIATQWAWDQEPCWCPERIDGETKHGH